MPNCHNPPTIPKTSFWHSGLIVDWQNSELWFAQRYHKKYINTTFTHTIEIQHMQKRGHHPSDLLHLTHAYLIPHAPHTSRTHTSIISFARPVTVDISSISAVLGHLVRANDSSRTSVWFLVMWALLRPWRGAVTIRTSGCTEAWVVCSDV